jgi:hypothetical protein
MPTEHRRHDELRLGDEQVIAQTPVRPAAEGQVGEPVPARR